jgi:radical SAM protein with 4Fe4S-binding SPASM domain
MKLMLDKNIHLIKISETENLFFHSKSLQIYPIRDIDLFNFLINFQKNGNQIIEKNKSYNQIYNFICDKISNAPKTTSNDNVNTQIEIFNAIVLPISDKCNLNCPYCFAQTNGTFNFKSFTCKDIEQTIKFTVDKNENKETPVSVIFFGGEPLLKLDIIKFTLEYCKNNYPSRKFNFAITTNGTIITDEIIKIFKDNNFAVLFSLDGYENEFNLRKFKNGKSSVPLVLKNLQRLKDNGIFPELRATLLNNNPYICETYDFFEKLELPFNIVFAYVSENTSNQYANYDKRILQSIEVQFNKLQDYYINKVKNRENLYNKLIAELASYLRFRIKTSIACGAGYNYFTVTADGNIFSCPHLMNDKKYAIGNILEGVKSKSDFTPVKIDSIVECNDCWLRYLCNGGCPSQKISAGRSNMSSMGENECNLEKLKWEFYIKLYYHIMTIAPEYFVKPQKND